MHHTCTSNFNVISEWKVPVNGKQRCYQWFCFISFWEICQGTHLQLIQPTVLPRGFGWPVAPGDTAGNKVSGCGVTTVAGLTQVPGLFAGISDDWRLTLFDNYKIKCNLNRTCGSIVVNVVVFKYTSKITWEHSITCVYDGPLVYSHILYINHGLKACSPNFSESIDSMPWKYQQLYCMYSNTINTL